MKPPKSILDPAFKYIPAAQTDLAKRFAAIRKAQKEAEKMPKAAVTAIRRTK